MSASSSVRDRLSSAWWIVAALSVTTTAGYGVLAYAFAVFLVPMQHDLHASRTALTVAPAINLLTAAAAAVPAGRWFDKRGGRGLMVGSAVLATAGVFAWSQVQDVVQLYAVSVVLGVASAGVLYEAAFAVVVSWFHGPKRGTAMLAISIVGGFASTIFLPLSGLLVEWYDWRKALVVLAVIYGLLTIPLHLVVRRPPAVAAPDGTSSMSSTSLDSSTPEGGSTTAATAVTATAATTAAAPAAGPPRDRAEALQRAFHDPAYWLIAASFVAESIGVFVISVHLVAYLGELGHPPTTAASVAGLLGVLSVAGRIVTTAAGRRYTMTSVVAAIFVVQAVGLLLLPWVGSGLPGAVACVLAVGLGFGVGTIARPAMVAERYGVAGYATLAGLLAAFLMVTKAITPLGAAWLRTSAGSYTPVMVICAVASVVGAAGLVLTDRLAGREA